MTTTIKKGTPKMNATPPTPEWLTIVHDWFWVPACAAIGWFWKFMSSRASKEELQAAILSFKEHADKDQEILERLFDKLDQHITEETEAQERMLDRITDIWKQIPKNRDDGNKS